MRWFLFFGCLVALANADRIAFLPFSDLTSYKGQWELSRDVAGYAGRCLGQTYSVIPFDSVFGLLKEKSLTPSALNTSDAKYALCRALGADFLLDGEIEEFAVRKVVMGEGRFGGVKNYKAEIKVKLRVYNTVANGVIYTEEVSALSKKTLTAVNLLKLSDDEAAFDTLNYVKFGSPQFEKSIAGEMMHELCGKIVALMQNLPKNVTKRDESKRLIKVARIVDIAPAGLFINAGSEDQVRMGDVFSVYTKGDSLKDPDTGEYLGQSERRVGTLRIEFVEASHFSRAKVLDENEPIKIKDFVRIEK
ncbi:MAG: hypothetical protein A2293_01625 [Elusimicrobia bacterium RIFOXYB2_FULL_49_7]|nr:MAG: hypothetical protein A2293_01625 [Elusimicrobia bacterium RIFOXYB2_FULL_49_7]